MAKFIHLRTHTEYSLCSGAIKIKDFIKQLKKHNIPAAAMTESHNMFGVLEYSMAAIKEGIQPIIGCEVMVDASKITHTENCISIDLKGEDKLCKMVLLAKNDQGFLNLISLLSQSYLKREKFIKPHIKIENFVDKKEGIIVLTGGVDGPIGKALISDNYNLAKDITGFLKSNFDDLYIEIQRHGIKEEIHTEDNFIKLAYEYNIPLVATNNCHFYAKSMFEAQDTLSCIADARYVSEINRPRLTPEHYFKSEEEMLDLFHDLPEAIENSVNIAQQISTMAYSRKPTLPHFDLPKGVSEAEEMARIARNGLEERLKQKFIIDDITDPDKQKEIREQYFNQLEFEIGVINQMDFPGYFLICADFIVWSKTHDVPIGPGRGSGAGSMVAWAMKITNLDPIKFSLFFERFLNPERVSMPDFDVDFCQRGRARSIEYVQNKYGKDSVAQIITFGKLQSKAVLKDVGRVLEMGYAEVDKISKAIPFDTSLEAALEMDSDLRSKRQQSDSEIMKLFDIAIQLEGLNRHSSVHAAGLVIGDKPLEQICPLYFDDSAEMPVVQYNMKYCETVGLVKFDFLGLKTLTVIKDAVDYIYEITGKKIDIDNIRLDDPKTFDLLKRADSLAVFQIESLGMMGMLKQIKPDNIEDIIALISLYRPGPMDNIPTYIKRKHGKEPVEYMHPKMESILKDTYGIIIYQEQVMNIAKVLAGYTLGGADLLRRAMGKKIKEEMDKQRAVFVKGCKEFSDIDEGLSNEIFDLLAKFAEYGFNKAHAAAYAVISYQTAYLKTHFPVEFMTATLNMEIADTDKINYYLQDIKKHNIVVLPPDINSSDKFFRVELIDKVNNNKGKEYYHEGKELAIRYGLCAIKGVGEEVMELLVSDRKKNGKFNDVFDFCDRLGSKVINKKITESLAKSGSFDKIHANRRQINDSWEVLNNYAKTLEEERVSPQINLFDCFNNNRTMLPKLCNVDDWMGYDRCQREFEAFGFYLNNHPLDVIRKELSLKGITFFSEIEGSGIRDGAIIKIAGVVISSSIRSNEKGKYAYISISDPTDLVELTLFNSEMITQNKDSLDDKEHKQLVFECAVRMDESGLRLNVKDFWPLDAYLKNTKEGVEKVKYMKKFNFNDIKNKKENVIIEHKSNVFVNNAVIKISSDKCITELQMILDKTKNSGTGKFTNVEIVVDGVKIKLLPEFCLTDLEISRIRNIYGVESVDFD